MPFESKHESERKPIQVCKLESIQRANLNLSKCFIAIIQPTVWKRNMCLLVLCQGGFKHRISVYGVREPVWPSSRALCW